MSGGSLGQLRPAHFAAKIKKYGERPSFWQQYLGRCPRPHDDVFRGFSPDNTCPLCGGTGDLYRSMTLPDARASATAGKILANVLNDRRDKAPIELKAGDVQVAFLETDFPFREGDRLGLASRTGDHHEELVRGTDDGEKLWFYPVLDVAAVYIATGELPADSYALSPDATRVLFSGPDGPASPSLLLAPGVQYTIAYRHRPIYQFVPGSFVRTPPATNGDPFPTVSVVRVFNRSPFDQKAGDP